MNKALKEVIKKIEEIDIKYQRTDEKDGIMISLYNEVLERSIIYLITIIDIGNNNYILSVITGGIFKVKNEIELLKTLNEINWENGTSLINYSISTENEVHVKANSFDTFEDIANDSIVFVKNINDDLEQNYEKIMKSNWA